MFPRMDTEKAYNRALDTLYSFVDYSLKKSTELARADFNLDRMRALLERLGNPQEKYPTLHVAGTKGKGSTCALMASAIQAAGYKTGLYISPHLQDFVERIQVNGKPISHRQLVDLVEKARPHFEAIPALTTFEITTALAFLCFADQKVDAAVIEVGLGGRLDATNVITPRVSVITSLSYDHMAVLGNTLTLIAGEKAGIIKPGVPVVAAPQVEEAQVVLERIARERGCRLIQVGEEVLFERLDQNLEGQTIRITGSGSSPLVKEPIRIKIPLLGRHQEANAATAYAALLASGLQISPSAVQSGFKRVSWPCRFEIVRREPPIILDSAHNTDSFEKLDQTLQEVFPGRQVLLIFGCSEDKDMSGMLSALRGGLRMVLGTHAEHPRAVVTEKIREVCERLGIPVETFPSVQPALDRALSLAGGTEDIVLSAGSMFVTAEVKTAWEKKVKDAG